MSSDQKYWAFISYSHRDKVWGDWLHKAMESYRVPKALVGKPTSRGELVPARAYPVFRDREELPTAVDLGAVINRALQDSRYLIVICSPNSARSQWVNQEIINFKKLGHENRVLAIIVDGEPNASDAKPGFTPEQECFPPALKFKLGPDGELSDERTEPIAADARPGKDGKPNALLKLLAGVLGVNFDDLRQRDAARRRKQRQLLAASALLVAAVTGLAVGRFADEQRERKFQSAIAELGRARQMLADSQPYIAASAALNAIETAEQTGRSLEPAWWVLRRALNANRTEARWSAGQDSISTTLFDRTGSRLLTFSSGTGEAKLWSVPDGGLASVLPTPKGTDFAAFDADGQEVVTVDSWYKDAPSFNEPSSSGVDLTWWNAITGEKQRGITIPNTRFFSHYHLATVSPQWIVADDWNQDTPRYRMIRLSDGWAEQTLPTPEKSGWGTGPVPVPDCGVVLLVDPAVGVTMFTLAGDQRNRGPLEGISATEKLRLSNLVPSVDQATFACLVWSGETLIGAGAWRAQDGSRITWQDAEKNEFGSSPWMAPAGKNGITSNRLALIEPLASAIGRTTLESECYSAAAFAWHEPDDKTKGPVALALEPFNKASLYRPADGWHLQLADNMESGALSPDGRFAAIGDQHGGVTLVRTAGSYSVESSLPPSTEIVKDVTMIGPDHFPQIFLQTATDRASAWDPVKRAPLAEYQGLIRPPDTWLQFSASPRAGWLMVTPSLPLMQPVPAGWESSFYDLHSGRLLGRHPASNYQLATDQRRALAPEKNGWRVVRPGETGITSVTLEMPEGANSENASAAAFMPDSSRVLVAHGNGEIHWFDSDSGDFLRRQRFADDQVTSINSLTISPSGRWALLSTYQRWWRVDLSSGKSDLLFEGEDRPLDQWQFLDGENIIFGNSGSMLKWWRFPEFNLLGQIKMDGSMPKVGVSKDGDHFLIKPKWDDSLTIVRRQSGEVQSRLGGVIAIDSSGQMAAINSPSPTAEAGETLNVIRLRDNEILLEFPGVRTSEAFFAMDGSRISFVLDDRLVSAAIPYEEADLRERAEQLRSNLSTTGK